MFFDKVTFNKIKKKWGFMSKKISVENVYQNLLKNQVKLSFGCLVFGAGRKGLIRPIVAKFVTAFGIEQI